jgi:hypothetical protein
VGISHQHRHWPVEGDKWPVLQGTCVTTKDNSDVFDSATRGKQQVAVQ